MTNGFELFNNLIHVSISRPELFTICLIIYILGILYILFILQEVKSKSNDSKNTGLENTAYENDTSASVDATKNAKKIEIDQGTAESQQQSKGFLREFFDPTLAKEIFNTVFKKREGNLRNLIWVVIMCNVTFLASLGEIDFLYLYTRLKINWEGIQFSLHLTYSTFMALVGTLLMVGVFAKFFGISDAMIGIVSTVCSLITRPVYVRIFFVIQRSEKI